MSEDDEREPGSLVRAQKQQCKGLVEAGDSSNLSGDAVNLSGKERLSLSVAMQLLGNM